MGKGVCANNTWVNFQHELQKYFAPSNTKKEVRARLCQFKQMRSVCDYINQFTILMLKNINMSEKDSLFYF